MSDMPQEVRDRLEDMRIYLKRVLEPMIGKTIDDAERWRIAELCIATLPEPRPIIVDVKAHPDEPRDKIIITLEYPGTYVEVRIPDGLT